MGSKSLQDNHKTNIKRKHVIVLSNRWIIKEGTFDLDA